MRDMGRNPMVLYGAPTIIAWFWVFVGHDSHANNMDAESLNSYVTILGSLFAIFFAFVFNSASEHKGHCRRVEHELQSKVRAIAAKSRFLTQVNRSRVFHALHAISFGPTDLTQLEDRLNFVQAVTGGKFRVEEEQRRVLELATEAAFLEEGSLPSGVWLAIVTLGWSVFGCCLLISVVRPRPPHPAAHPTPE